MLTLTKSAVLVVCFSAAAPLLALAQSSGTSRIDERSQDEAHARTELRIHLRELFEFRSASPHYGQPLPVKTGNLIFSSECLWIPRERQRPKGILTIPRFLEEEDDQEDEQDDFRDDDFPPLDLPDSSPIVVIRDIRAGGRLGIPGTLGISDVKEVIPLTTEIMTFDEAETDLLIGGDLAVTLGLWDSVDVRLSFGYLSGSFTTETDFNMVVDLGHGGGPTPVVDTFELDGDLSLFQFGLGPVLRLEIVENLFDVELSVAGGACFGKLSSMKIKSQGAVVEDFSTSDESLAGGFGRAGLVLAWRFADQWAVELGGEYTLYFGDLEGGMGSVFLDIRFELRGGGS